MILQKREAADIQVTRLMQVYQEQGDEGLAAYQLPLLEWEHVVRLQLLPGVPPVAPALPAPAPATPAPAQLALPPLIDLDALD